MPKINSITIRRFFYAIRHKYWTLNNVVIFVALLIAANWVWGALSMMQRNYTLQREVDSMERSLQLVELEKVSLEYQQKYYKTDEYQELAVRKSLGLVQPGEKMIIISSDSSSTSTDAATTNGENDASSDTSSSTDNSEYLTSNFEQWMNFLFGGNSQSVEE